MLYRYIQPDTSFVGPLAAAVLPLYNIFASERLSRRAKCPEGFEGMLGMLYERLGEEPPEIVPYAIEAPRKGGLEQRVGIGYSSGLDSSYIALKLREQGEDVLLLHLGGLNRGYTNERVNAEAFAKAAGLEMVVCEVKQRARQHYPDNPLKNQLVMSIVLDRCEHVGMGCDWMTPLAQCEVGWTLTDASDLNRAFMEGVMLHRPSARLHFIGDGERKADRVAYLHERGLLPLVRSCIAPLRFQGALRSANMAKYGVELLDGRCGSCFKCCMEWLLMRQLGIESPHSGFEEHCWAIMAGSSTSHRKDLFGNGVPMKERIRNLMEYGS